MKSNAQVINCTTILLRINVEPVSFWYITVICSIMILICSIIALILNILTLLSVYRNTCLQTVQNIFICNTAVCDILFSAVVGPLWLYIVTSALFLTKTYCNPAIALSILSNFVGILMFLSLACITMDQYTAIIKPYFYHKNIHQNSKYYIIICISLWILNIFLHIINIKTPKRFLISVVIAIITPLTILLCLYCNYKIYKVLKQVRKTSRAQSISIPNSQDNVTDIGKEKKFLKMSSLMLVSLVLCYLPFVSIVSLRIIKRELYEQSNNVHLAYQIAITLVFLKPMINPILYCYQLTPLRSAIKRLCTTSVTCTNEERRETRSTRENSIAISWVTSTSM